MSPMITRKVWTIVLWVIVVGLAVFFFAGPGILLVAIAGSEFDRVLAPGIEIVNDTGDPIRFITMSDGIGYFADTSCWTDVFWCPTSVVDPGDRVLRSHGRRYTGEQVRVLVPMADEDYYEKTDEFYEGTSVSVYKVRDDLPDNAMNIQESSFLCYELDIAEAQRRWGGLLWRKVIYSYQWSDILEHDACSGVAK